MTDHDVQRKWMHTHLEHQQMKQLERYLRKDRPLKDDQTVDLERAWLGEMKAWADSRMESRDHTRREDIEAELQLRKHEPPHDLAAADFDRIRAASEQRQRELEANPDQLRRAERRLTDALDEFHSAAKKTQS